MSQFSKFEWERKNYPPLAQWVYLDHPSSGLIPQEGYRQMQSYLSDRLQNAHSYEDYVSNLRFADALRVQLGQMIGASGDDIAYGYNSSQLMNVFINGLGLTSNDNVVIPELAYDASRYALLNQQARGAEIRFAKHHQYATASQALFSLVDEHTKAIVVSHVEHGFGYRYDLSELGAFCRKNGIWLAVDATQSCGVMQLDVTGMQVDFLAVSCYKWLQSYLGNAFAYISPDLRKTLQLCDAGWTGVVDRFHCEFAPRYSQSARRFECGGLNFAGLHSLKVSVESYLRLGGPDIQAYVLSLVDYFYGRAEQELKQIRILGKFAPAHRSSILTLSVPDALDDEVLAQAGFRAHCPKPGLLRIGFHYCTNRKEIDRFIQYLKTIDVRL